MKSKAIFMLIIFLLNTAVGFSCALRMSHKDHDEKAERHEHHHHRVSLLRLNLQCNANSAYIGKDDPCCQGAVNNFVSLAKLVPQSGKVIIQIPVAYISPYYRLCLVTSPGVITHRQMSFDERQRPPTPNIRITIQSFQI